jgi:mycothiol system anti-sigma-R factor
MECKQVLARLWEYLDQELGPEEAYVIGAHLEDCAGCYPAYCCNRAFLQLLARQRHMCTAPSRLRVAVLSLLNG